MTGRTFIESTVEQAALAWQASIGWRVAHGPDIAPGELRVKDAEKFIGRAV